jgi:hypothetical protein
LVTERRLSSSLTAAVIAMGISKQGLARYVCEK